jgi:hypothetical protein
MNTPPLSRCMSFESDIQQCQIQFENHENHVVPLPLDVEIKKKKFIDF